jgi:hypothetical protein
MDSGVISVTWSYECLENVPGCHVPSLIPIIFLLDSKMAPSEAEWDLLADV